MQIVNDIAVSDALYKEIKAAKGRGAKCYLTRPEILAPDESWSDEYKDATCVNCNGAGKLGFEVITGGPYVDRVSATEFKGWNHKLNKDDPGPRATYIDGAWYLQKTREYTCPICHGSGSAPAGRERSAKLVF